MRRFATDTGAAYRANYPGQKLNNPKLNDNVLFYRGEIRDRPNNQLITDYHTKWRGDYHNLEASHGFIQWLFPIHEPGVNGQAQVLQRHEAETLRACPIARRHFLESYRLMLQFYGFVLESEETGIVARGPDALQRFRHLNSSFHNYLRITRMLKCLGNVGLEHLQAPWCRALAVEIFEKKTLANVRQSFIDYFIAVVRDDEQRRLLKNTAEGKAPKKSLSSLITSPKRTTPLATGGAAAVKDKAGKPKSSKNSPGVAAAEKSPGAAATDQDATAASIASVEVQQDIENAVRILSIIDALPADEELPMDEEEKTEEPKNAMAPDHRQVALDVSEDDNFVQVESGTPGAGWVHADPVG